VRSHTPDPSLEWGPPIVSFSIHQFVQHRCYDFTNPALVSALERKRGDFGHDCQ